MLLDPLPDILRKEVLDLRFSRANAITFGIPSTLLHFVTPNGGKEEKRRDQWRGNHPIAFGIRGKCM